MSDQVRAMALRVEEPQCGFFYWSLERENEELYGQRIAVADEAYDSFAKD